MKIADSELVLNPDGSIYHVNLLPDELADNVILVGDPNRVALVSKHFDNIEVKKSKREINAHTGSYKGKRFTVISTGMGPDNIDIVLNELDALVNIDFQKREIKPQLKSLNIVRIGTSGALQEDIPVDSFVLSKLGIGFDGVLHFYKNEGIRKQDIEDAFISHSNWNALAARPYVVGCGEELFTKLHSNQVIEGFTGTAVGFYGPQGRVLRLALANPEANHMLETFSYNGLRLTNYEMETSAIYALSKLMGHQACSLNCIIANRAAGRFAKDPYASVERLIKYTLDKLVE